MTRLRIGEDSKTIRKVLIPELGQLRVPRSCIIETSNGSEGLEAIEYVSGIRLVLADINMAEMDGFEFLRRIRAVHSAPDHAVFVAHSESSSKNRKRGPGTRSKRLSDQAIPSRAPQRMACRCTAGIQVHCRNTGALPE